MGDTAQAEAYRPPKLPKVQTVTASDVRAALKAGVQDFVRAPQFGLFFGGIYALGGLFILACLYVFDMPWMIIPVAIGFPLVGPFVAVGLYEVSRRRAAGTPVTWREVLFVVLQQHRRELGWMCFVVLFVFWIWIYQVRILLAIFLGYSNFSSIWDFLEIITTTTEGLGFIGVGTLVGGFLSLVLFSATVIAMPLLLDREVDFISAMIVSFKTVLSNPMTMIGWAIVIVVLTVLALLPAFLGLFIILPILGHTTWHLYTRAIEAKA